MSDSIAEQSKKITQGFNDKQLQILAQLVYESPDKHKYDKLMNDLTQEQLLKAAKYYDDLQNGKSFNENESTLDKISNSPTVAAINAASAETTASITNLLSKVGLVSNKTNQKQQTFANQKDEDFENTNPAAGDRLLKNVLHSAPAFAASEGLSSSSGIATEASNLAESLLPSKFGLSKIASFGAKSIPTGITYSALTNDPSQSIGEQLSVGAVAGVVGEALGNVITSLPQLFRNILGSNATTVKIINNLKQLKGKTAIAGDVINSNRLRDIQSGLLVGASPSQVKDLNSVINERAKEASDIGNDIDIIYSDQDPLKKLTDKIVENKNLAQNKKNELYNTRDKISLSSPSFPIEFNNTRQVASEYVQNAEDSANEFGNLEDTKFYNIMKDFSDKKDSSSIIRDENGIPVRSNLTAIQTRKKQLDGLAASENDTYKKAAYKRLSSALGKDLKESINNSGNEELINAQNDADNYFSNNFSLFKDKSIQDIMDDETKFREKIRSMAKTGKNQTPESLNMLIEAASKETGTPEEARALILQDALKGTIEVNENNGNILVNPTKLTTFYDKLSQPMRDALFSESQQEALQNLSNNMKLSKTALKSGLNPATGYNIVPTKGASGLVKGVGALSYGLSGINTYTGNDSAAEQHLAIGSLLLFGPTVAAKVLSNKTFLTALAKDEINSGKTVGSLAKALAINSNNS